MKTMGARPLHSAMSRVIIGILKIPITWVIKKRTTAMTSWVVRKKSGIVVVFSTHLFLYCDVSMVS